MKKLFALVCLMALSACSGGGGGSGSSEVADPIYGDWYYQLPGGTSTQVKGIIAHVEKGKVRYSQVYAYSDGKSTVFYHRKSEGTYVRNGKSFQITYSYETCNPVGSETLEMSVNGDALTVSSADSGVSFVLVRAASSTNIQSMLAIEDKNCNILSKIEKTQKRSVANSKIKSFFGGFLK